MRKHQQKPDSSGIEFDAPRLIGQNSSAAAEFTLGTILVLLGVFGAVWCFISAFTLRVLPLTIVLYSLIFILALAAIQQMNRIRYIFLFAMILLYAGAGFYLHTELIQGFLITTNQIMMTYARHSDLILPIYDVSAKQADFPLMCTIFILFAVFFLSFFLCWAILRRQSFALSFIATLPFPFAALIFNIIPDFYAVLMLVTCWTMLLFIRLSGGNKRGFVKLRHTHLAKSPSAAAKAGLQLLLPVILCFTLILSIFPRQTYQYSTHAGVLRNEITNAVTSFSLFDGGATLAGSTNRVNLNGAGSIHFTGKTMLQVQATEQYPAFLKGFVGSVYTGTSWEPLPDSEYKEINQKLNGMNVQNMCSTLLALQHPDIDTGAFGIHVKNIGANKTCIYAPYNLTTTPQQITGVKFVNDQILRSNWIFGTGEYSLYSNSFGGEPISSNVLGVFSSIASQHINRGNLGIISKILQSYITSQQEFAALNSGNLKAYYTSTVPDDLMNALQGEGKDFIKEEQNYRLFLYDKYTQLPQSIREKVQRLLEQENMMGDVTVQQNSSIQYAGPVSYDSLEQMTNAVKRYLAKHCSYSLTPGKAPSGRDFTDYFLFENRKGYCVHFATAAVVMLRAMGVPARYAEGYIITADDYKNASDGWASIKDNRAHAWVEVYYPGLGWQPVEVTPGFNVASNQTQDDISKGESSVSSTPSVSGPESSAASKSESQAESHPQSEVSRPKTQPLTKTDDVKAAMVPILFTIAAIGFILAAAALKRRVAIKHREKSFAQQDQNRAAIAIYDYVVRLTRFGGEVSKIVTDIALKARFSQHTVNAEELETMRNHAELLARQNLFNASTVQKILMKYLYNLI